MGGFVLFGLLFFLGYPFLAVWLMRKGDSGRIESLERQVRLLRNTVEELQRPPGSAPVGKKEATAPAAPRPAPDSYAAAAGVPVEPAGTEPTQPAAASSDEAAMAAASGSRAQQPAASSAGEGISPAPKVRAAEPPRWWLAFKRWLFTGNLVAKLGLVVLFIGVGFLLKYVAETYTIPIELRLAGVAFADLFLLGWGWRIRNTRRGIGLPVQGTAIAILMLVVFAALQQDLISAAVAFPMLVVLTAFTCLLAVLQNAIWLAAFGIAGGFACPLLVSTGAERHVALFSYYVLLNAGVFALAIKRNWRLLNLIGFAFTFVVGAAWGGLKYTPDYYLSSQLFLIVFFVFYVAIALAFARQQQTRLKNYVDATLVLGTPLLAFGLQVGLVRDKPFGLALSAFALGTFYLAVAVSLWRRARGQYRVLVETFLALGVVFASLAIPFALEGRWTSGVWALEGAGFVWLGLRQREPRIWGFGLLLQLGAWYSFILAASGLDKAAAANSNLWLGFLLLAGSAFGIATNFRRHGQQDKPSQSWLSSGYLVMAAVWFLAGFWVEIIVRTKGTLLANLLVASAIITATLLNIIASRMEWRLSRKLALVAQLAGAGALIVVSSSAWNWMDLQGSGDKPLVGALMISIAALVTSRSMQRALGERADMKLSSGTLLWGGFWWFGPVLNIVSGRIVPYLPAGLGAQYPAWTASYEVCLAASALGFGWLARRLDWASLRWLSVTCWVALIPATIEILAPLYGSRIMPDDVQWISWAVLLAAGEYLMLSWQANEWPMRRNPLAILHALRTAGPWLAIWPAGAILVSDWLRGPAAQQSLMAQAGWAISASWSNYLPTWAMIVVLGWLVRRSRQEKWPTTPLADWYRSLVLPIGAMFLVLLVTIWNFTQDGTMAPLPYLPVLNPLDLTTGFVLLLGIAVARLQGPGEPGRMSRIGLAAAGSCYLWFNLVLLRSAAQYLDIAYAFEPLMASQFVQAMLSLVWTSTALVLMRHAATRLRRRQWGVGAALLGIVVAKLILADLKNGGSMARVISFVGVGLLMVLIGYFAPYPKAAEHEAVGAGTNQ